MLFGLHVCIKKICYVISALIVIDRKLISSIRLVDGAKKGCR